MSTFKQLSLFATLLITSILITGCEEENTTEPTPTETGNLMVIHTSPDAPNVDVFIDEAEVATDLAFPNNTNYLEVVTGTRNIKANAASSTDNIINVNLEFIVDKNYSLFTIDKLDNIAVIFMEDDLTAPAAGKAHIRFIHLIPDGPAVDIAVQGGGGGPILQDLAFKGTTTFIEMDAATITLKIKDPDGQQGNNDLITQEMVLEDGKIYTIALVGLAEDNSTAMNVIANN